MPLSRRRFFQQSLAVASTACIPTFEAGGQEESAAGIRRYNLSVSIDALKADPGLLETVRDAGVSSLWLACFFHGKWHHSVEEVAEWTRRIGEAGMGVHHITVPLGHPSFTDKAPDYSAPVSHSGWKPGTRPDGKTYWGVSLHPPATQQNVEALREIKAADPGTVFLDDDFRLAPSPHDIGGCFCEEHREEFLRRHGYGEGQWTELLEAVRERRLTPILRAWVEDVGCELTDSFTRQRKAAQPEMELGIMVMYLGSEKAGIRLSDYTDVPFRVGELMFDDASFSPVKGKTDELFSSLFHRRFVEPERAYSETTAWPPDKLSAANMAAKLAVSTISDVRNTMFMSGIVAFPRTHWETLGPAMRKQAQTHRQVAGHKPVGPFKHFWGEHSRWVGDANPFSLFMAAGVPFEVTDRLGTDGWTFLSDADARAAAEGKLASPGTSLLSRGATGSALPNGRHIEESLEALFAVKREILPQLGNVPYVREEVPVVCAWYPTTNAVLLWNLTEKPQKLTLVFDRRERETTLSALDTALLSGIA